MALSTCALAQAWPQRTTRIIVPFGAGGGAEPVGSTPEELAAFMRREVQKYAKVIRAANVQVE